MQTRADGTIALLRTTKLPLRDVDGTIVGLMGFFTEITEGDLTRRSLVAGEADRNYAIDASVRSMDFALLYQPIFDTREVRMTGVEALLRWNPPREPLRPPGCFLPYLESSGLIRPVGLWVVDQACRQLAEWRRRLVGARDLTVSVNISRVQFESPSLVDDLAARVASAGLEPRALTLEITETAVSSAEADIVTKLADLKDRGFRIAVDDFGVGQSSLSVLCDLPVDIVKIDRSFITSATPVGDPACAGRIATRDRVLRAVIDLVRNLGLETIVEGVETAEQHDQVRSLGCDGFQGYWRARPGTPAQISAMV